MPRRLRSLLAWLPAVLVVPAAMVGSIQLSESDTDQNPLLELQPLDHGTTWVYDVFDHGEPSGTHTKQVTGKAAVNFDRLDGTAVVGTYTDYPGRGARSSLTYLSLDDDTMFQDGFRQDGEYLVLDPAAPALELPLEKDASWSYDGTFGTAGLKLDSTVEDIEDVTVGGHVFHDCLHIVTELDFTFESGGGDKETTEDWSCPGFGTVRTTDTIPAQDVVITEELIEFHGAEGDWFADEPATATAVPQPGDTIGFDAGRTRAVAGVLDPMLAWSDLRSVDIAYPPVADDRVMVLGEEDGLITGMDVTTGELRWRQSVTGPVVAPLAIGADRALVADARKNLWALDTADGTTRWVHHFDDVVSTSPVVAGPHVVVVTDDGRVTALDLADGGVVWQRDLGVRARSAPAVADHVVVVPDVTGGTVTALDLETGSTTWSQSVDGILTSGPAVADGRVLVTDDFGLVYAFSAEDGSVEWETRTNGDPAGDLALSVDAATVLGGTDRLESFALDDGHRTWSRDIGATDQSPVVVGDEVITVGRHGRVSVRDLADGTETRSWLLPRPASDADLNVDVPIGFVDGSIVIGAELNAEALTTGLFAYPTSADSARRGASFDVEIREVPAPPSSPPTLVGDSLILPGGDNTLYLSTGRDEVETIASGTSVLPGVVAAGDLLVAQVDDEVRGYPLAGGDQRWRFPAADPFFAAVPTIAGDRVFVPEYGLGLAAVSTEGDPLWFTPVDGAFGTGAPVALSEGDVFWGPGGAARYDGDTGDRIWTIPDSQTYGSATYAEGVVFADLSRSTHASGPTAIDAATGRIRWVHENANTPFFVGPAAADGVTVFGDAGGLVVAFDAEDGTPLWQVRLSSPLAGPPVIIDGRVYLAEQGRAEDLFQRDYRLSAHDLHTGAFVGAFQPSASTFTGSPSVTGTADGRLLVPTGGGLGPVVLILEPR